MEGGAHTAGALLPRCPGAVQTDHGLLSAQEVPCSMTRQPEMAAQLVPAQARQGAACAGSTCAGHSNCRPSARAGLTSLDRCGPLSAVLECTLGESGDASTAWTRTRPQTRWTRTAAIDVRRLTPRPGACASSPCGSSNRPRSASRRSESHRFGFFFWAGTIKNRICPSYKCVPIRAKWRLTLTGRTLNPNSATTRGTQAA